MATNYMPSITLNGVKYFIKDQEAQEQIALLGALAKKNSVSSEEIEDNAITWAKLAATLQTIINNKLSLETENLTEKNKVVLGADKINKGKYLYLSLNFDNGYCQFRFDANGGLFYRFGEEQDDNTIVWTEWQNYMVLTGSYTPEGVISKINLNPTITYSNINILTSQGTLPSMTYRQEDETLIFDPGTLPEMDNQRVISEISFEPDDLSFAGVSQNITVSK